MARTLQLSYISLNSTNKDTWTDFTDVNTLYPEISLLAAPYTAGGRAKITGEDLPGIHGLYPVKGMVADQLVRCEFLVRHRESSQDAQAVIRRFVTWLYSVGEVRVSFDNEPFYRRMKYTEPEQYTVFDGIHGYDVRLSITLTCLDSLVYLQEEITIANTEDTSRELMSDGFSTYLSGIEIVNLGVETPLEITLSALNQNVPMTSTNNGYWWYVEVTQDNVHYDRFSFSFGDGPTTYTKGRFFQLNSEGFTFVSRTAPDGTGVDNSTVVESVLQYAQPLGKPDWEKEMFPDKIINETVMPTLKPGINIVNACYSFSTQTLNGNIRLRYKERYL